MKIKSRVDVITNSSTEVFMMKTSDYEDVIKKFPGILDAEDKATMQSFQTLEDLEDEYKQRPYSQALRYLDLDVVAHSLLKKYELPGNTKRILKEFGHTQEEIEAYEKSKDEFRIKARDSSTKLQSALGTTIGVWYDHHWGNLSKIKNYLSKNKIPFTYYGP